MKPWLRNSLVALAILIVAFGLIQLVPYRVTNSSVNQEPKWDSPRTRQLAVAACFDCHSNQTHTTWWEDVAPLSWWITNHVKEGRDKLNFSEWSSGHGGGSDDAVETVRNGSMPPSYYTWLGMHSNAKLTPAQRQQLADGLQKTLGGGGG
jgi:mono/diheme cytochrome c family protein